MWVAFLNHTYFMGRAPVNGPRDQCCGVVRLVTKVMSYGYGNSFNDMILWQTHSIPRRQLKFGCIIAQLEHTQLLDDNEPHL